MKPTDAAAIQFRRPRLDALTSLRFFAAAMIGIGHAHPLFGSLGLAYALSLDQGVSFFFVLSGFILAYNYPDVERDVASFYKARFARIWPLHVVAILLLPLLVRTWNPGGLSPMGKIYVGIGNLLLIQSWVPLRDSYLTFNGVAWSISTEAAFYLFFPIATVLMKRNIGLPMAISAALTAFFICATIYWKIPIDSSLPFSAMGTLYVNPLARLFEFVLGMAACRAYFYIRPGLPTNRIFWTVAEAVLVLASVASMHWIPRLPLRIIFPSHAAPVIQYYLDNSGSAPVFAALIVACGVGAGFISRFLACRALVFLGEVSFAFYLVHATVLLWLTKHPAIVHSSVGYLCFWGISLSIATALHVGVERPARRFLLRKRKAQDQEKRAVQTPEEAEASPR
ncbi:MAG TPA: acyltransferase [Acidocella sp.]|jgi:peptidoglycan/LPS O-acetylase OafA/YrhL|uniref:acyltransferase family protein n=1 Tax=Acidocella sp. TaxID=50710 RepID=UPI002D01E636|nr:acyltransferase [Acidocella sp.]HVE22194.1 acyltransferase [Acidocella sp.]